MKVKFVDLISIIKNKKKEFIELFIFDFLSILIATIIYIMIINFIYYAINCLNINLNLPFNLKPILFWFVLVWCFGATITTIVFHFLTLYTINKNSRSMLAKDGE